MSARLKPLTPEISAVHRFGALLRRLRIEAGYSQPELSSKLYTSKSTLSRAETGVRLLARDLAEACDELLGANGSLLAAWPATISAPTADLPGERTRGRRTAGSCIPSPCVLALWSRSAHVGGFGRQSTVRSNGWCARSRLAKARRAESVRDCGRVFMPGQAKQGRYPLHTVGDALSAPPRGVSSRIVARSRSTGARGIPPRGSAGGGLSPWTYTPCRVHGTLARVAACRV